MKENNFKYNYQYKKWHNSSEESIKYDIEENLKLLDTHNIYPKDKSSVILEPGCATGCFMQALQLKGFKNITGIDIDAELIEEAKSRELNVINCNAVDFLSQNTEKYDVIYCLDLLEHLQKQEQIHFLSLIETHLKDNGFCVLKVPNALTPLESYFRYIDFTHCISYTTDSLSFLLMNAGFKHFVFRAQHPEDYELRIAKHNYAFMLYKQFGLTQQILTPNIVVVAFKNENDKTIYQNTTAPVINDYYEKENLLEHFEIMNLILFEQNCTKYKLKYKLFDFMNFITLQKISFFINKKTRYKNLYELSKRYKLSGKNP